MDMSERKKKILSAAVEEYIKTGEPVGSKAIVNCLDISVSSATVRNELSELAEMGLLNQPHTSSGRVPTHSGYRFYVDRLMNECDIDEYQRRRIDTMWGIHFNDPEKLLEKAGTILADITNCAVVSSTPSSEDAFIKKIDLLPVSKKTAIVILMTSNGLIKERVCRTDTEITEETVEMFYNVLAADFQGKNVTDIDTLTVQNLAVSFGMNFLEMTPFIIALSDIAEDISKADILLEGQTNLFSISEIGTDVNALIELLRRRDTVSSLLSAGENKINLFIGKENPYEQFGNSSMIVAKYTVNSKDSGAFGIIGSTRMDYAKIVPSIKYLTEIVGNLFSRTLTE